MTAVVVLVGAVVFAALAWRVWLRRRRHNTAVRRLHEAIAYIHGRAACYAHADELDRFRRDREAAAA